jgi:hypothetical protein
MSVNGLAPALNTIPFTSVSAEKNTFFVPENANVAVSAAPFGIVAGVQFAAVFHVPEPGFAFQVALPAKAATGLKMSVKPKMAIASESESLTRGTEVGLEVSNGGVIPPRLVEELFIDCIVLVRFEVELFVADEMNQNGEVT